MILSVRDRALLAKPLRDAGLWPLLGLSALQLAGALVPAATALVLASLVGRLSASSATDAFRVALAPLTAFAAVLLVGNAVQALVDPLRFAAQQRIDGAHRARVARLAASSATVDRLERPEVQERLDLARADPWNWTERTPGQGALTQLLGALGAVGVATSCAVLLRYAWWLIPIVVLPAAAARQFGLRRGMAFLEVWERGVVDGRHADRWAKVLSEPAEAKEVRVFGFAEWGLGRQRRHLMAMFEPAWAHTSRDLVRQCFPLLLGLVGIGTAYGTVALGAARGHTSVATETGVFAAVWSVYTGFFGFDTRDLLGALPGLRATEELERMLPPPVAAGDEAAGPIAGNRPPLVRFEQVEFTYPGTERSVLRGLDLEIRPGELLAVVGMNGAGKSTLIKLLSQLYVPTAGRITADGVDLADVAPGRWRQRISVVFQDFVRYGLSLADNIMLGQADPPVPLERERLLALAAEAAEDAGLGRLVEHMPGGWETPLTRSRTGGIDLSGGQWQQVALTRALFAVRTGAQLLVLDEPTAHLDVRTEFEVFTRLAEHRQQSSVVLISHRLSTVRQADRIVVLDGGAIVESGTHDELMAAAGEYARMFTIQAERFAAGHEDRLEVGDELI